jgi:phosphatidylglycerophosphate synthase
MLMCERAGVKRFFIQAMPEQRPGLELALGAYRDHPAVSVVESFDQMPRGDLTPDSPCLMFSGNLVLSAAQLRAMVERYEREPGKTAAMTSADHDRSGTVAIGPLEEVLSGLTHPEVAASAAGYLPFALNGRPEDRDEAELRLARSLRHDTKNKDALMARIFDRHLSWRLSLRLARTRVTPNQVTLANTVLGLICAWMFAIPSYGWRLAASLLFVASVTIDGVDGEMARLQMSESAAGGRLDQITDNIVHVAIFIGIMLGCYRAGGSVAYLYLMLILLGGFGLCALAVNRALSLEGAETAEFIGKVERFAGRDFAYLLLALALINWLPFFCWGTAIGTYVFAAGLWWRTNKLLSRTRPAVR